MTPLQLIITGWIVIVLVNLVLMFGVVNSLRMDTEDIKVSTLDILVIMFVVVTGPVSWIVTLVVIVDECVEEWLKVQEYDDTKWYNKSLFKI